ncbi:hypothetical protein BGZ98_002950, partial [Dissophora globulifera]
PVATTPASAPQDQAPATPSPPATSEQSTPTTEAGSAPEPTPQQPAPAQTPDAPTEPVSPLQPTPETPSPETPSDTENEPSASSETRPSPSKDTHSSSRSRSGSDESKTDGSEDDAGAYATGNSDDSQGRDAKSTGVPTASSEVSRGSSTGTTIGIVVAAILIAGAIGVWIFRKWKLAPSRQFKSKIAGHSDHESGSTAGLTCASAGVGGAAAGGAAAIYGGSIHDDCSDYQSSYDNIYHQHSNTNLLSHDPTKQPQMESIIMMDGSASILAATAMSSPAATYQQQQHYPHPYDIPQHPQDYGYEHEYQARYEDQQQYGYHHLQQQGQMHHQYPQHQQHLSMSRHTSGSVTNYGQYRHAHSESMASSVPSVAMVSGRGGPIGNGGGVPGMGHNIHGYGSEDYTQNDQFLRELRE